MPSRQPDTDLSPADATFSASRRSLLLGAVAGGSALAVAPSASAALPLRRPLQAEAVRQSFGVNALPNHLDSGYRFHDQWLNAIADMNVPYFRGYYAPGLPKTLEVVAGARRRGIKWAMTVTNTRSATRDQIQRAVRHIATHAADVCLYIEGLNEPDYHRGVGAVTTDWMTDTLRVQRLIWEAVKAQPRLSRVKVVGPSLHDTTSVESDYRRMAERGLLSTMDFGGIHRYPNGTFPDHLMNERLAMLRRAWGRTPIWITETGYTNAVANLSGHKPVPEAVAGEYAPSSLLEAADRGCRVAWFEVLDQPDAGVKNDREANFGLYGTGSGDGPPWRAKPAVASIRSLLTSLRDPGPAFTPAEVRFRATGPADLRATLTAKRTGAVTAHLRRATDCWDTRAQRRIPVAASRVTVETASGTRYVNVDHRVTSIRL